MFLQVLASDMGVDKGIDIGIDMGIDIGIGMGIDMGIDMGFVLGRAVPFLCDWYDFVIPHMYRETSI